MTYRELLKHCKRTLDLHEDAEVSLRDMAKIVARNYENPHTSAAIYACLWSNVVEYLDSQGGQ